MPSNFYSAKATAVESGVLTLSHTQMQTYSSNIQGLLSASSLMNNQRKNAGQHLPRGRAGTALAKSGSLGFPFSLTLDFLAALLPKAQEAEEIPLLGK